MKEKEDDCAQLTKQIKYAQECGLIRESTTPTAEEHHAPNTPTIRR